MMEEKYSKNATLCWRCANAYKGCCWSKNFEPVEGWEATPTKIKQHDGHYTDSYCVRSCPEFAIDDGFVYTSMEDLAQKFGVSLRNITRMGKYELYRRCRSLGYKLLIEYFNGKRHLYIKPINENNKQTIPLEVIKLFWKTIGYTEF